MKHADRQAQSRDPRLLPPTSYRGMKARQRDRETRALLAFSGKWFCRVSAALVVLYLAAQLVALGQHLAAVQAR